MQHGRRGDGESNRPYPAPRLAALQGNEAECSTLIAAVFEHAKHRGQGSAVIHAHWAAAVLYNGLARYEQAASAARQATTTVLGPSLTAPCAMWTLPELVEAAAHAGDGDLARSALERLEQTALPSGNDVALGSWPDAERCCKTARPPRSCIARRSTDSAGHDSARRSAARISSMENGSDARDDGSTLACNSAPPTTCSPTSA